MAGHLASQVMGGGFSQGQAIAIGGTYKAAISAAGTTQGTATALTAANNNISTVAASAGVKLPAVQPGDVVAVFNAGANTLTVYPPTSAAFNALAVNAGVLLGTNTYAEFNCVTSTLWFVNLSA